MRNILALIGLAVVGFGGAGWYLGWYKVSFDRTADGKLQIKTDVDTGRVIKDAGEGAKQVGAFLSDNLEQAGKDAKAGQQPTPGTTPGPVNTSGNTQSGWLFGHDFKLPDRK